MDSLEHSRSIAVLLRDILNHGFSLNDQLRHYMDSTLGGSSYQEVSEVIADDTHCEREPLLDLLLFPGIALKAQLEALLPDTPEQRNFPDLLLKNFLADTPETGVLFPDANQTLHFDLTPDLAQRFIARLHLDSILDRRLLEAVADFGPGMGAKLRVRLRCARLGEPDRDVELLCNFCRRFPAPETIFISHFEFFLAFLETLDSKDDPFSGLMQRKRLVHKMLKQAQDFERKLQREPIEALMLRGERYPSICIDDAKLQMSQIDRISLALFGRTEDIPEEIDYDHGSFDPDSEMDSVLQLFQQG